MNKIYKYSALVGLLQLGDIFSTMLFLLKGIAEANPIVNDLLSSFGLSGLFIAKLFALLPLLGMNIVYYLGNIFEKNTDEKIKIAGIIEKTLIGLVVISTLIIVWNIYTVVRLFLNDK